VRVARDQDAIRAVRIPAGEADLLVGCDLVVATSYEAMGKAAVDRTRAVINDAEVPTAEFIRDPDARFPSEAMKHKIRTEVGADDCDFMDSTAIATRLLGDSIASNLFLLGYAWQRGLVPVSAAALERAIELNGVAVDFNRQAFLWGRRFAHQPARVLEAAGLAAAVHEALPTPPLDELIADRAARLEVYQDAAYAARYRTAIAALRARDPRAEEPGSVTAAAAAALHKLMAYKDEYEVARLYSDPAFLEGLDAQFEGDYRLRFNLAPPLLAARDPATGQPRKREFGAWVLPLFRLLARLRRLRGTPLDVFGYTAERRGERADLADYLSLLEDLGASLNAGNYETARELAALPMQLRGFGHVKDRNREQLAPRRELLLRRLRGEEPGQTVKLVEAARAA
jgi:indolepyruvate ferredoxin oxidoreductase